MFKPPPLDIAPDLRLTIGASTVQVTPKMGMALAESLIRASAREAALQERQKVEFAPPRRRGEAPTPKRKASR